MTTLDNTKVGQTVEVVKVHGEGSSLRRRLLDMGITPKTQVTLVRCAPLGDPIEFKIKGYDVCLRKEEAKNIIVE